MDKVLTVINDIKFVVTPKEIILDDSPTDFELLKESQKLREAVARITNNIYKFNFGKDVDEFKVVFKGESIIFDIEGNLKINRKANLNKLLEDLNNILKKPKKTNEDWNSLKEKINEIQKTQQKIEEAKETINKLTGTASSKDITPKKPIFDNIKPLKMSIKQSLALLEDFIKKTENSEHLVKAFETIKNWIEKEKDKKTEEETKDFEKTSKISEEAKKFISKKIKKLKEEGYDQKQAIAIAYSMAKEKGFDVPIKSKSSKIYLVYKISKIVDKMNKISKETSYVDITEQKVIDEQIQKVKKILKEILEKTENLKIKQIIKQLEEKLEEVEKIKNKQEELKEVKSSLEKKENFSQEELKEMLTNLKKDFEKLEGFLNKFNKKASKGQLIKEFINVAEEIIRKNKPYIEALEVIQKDEKFGSKAKELIHKILDKISFIFNLAKQNEEFENLKKDENSLEKIKFVENFLKQYNLSKFSINEKVWLKDSNYFDNNFGYVVAKTNDKIVVQWNDCELMTEENPEDLVVDSKKLNDLRIFNKNISFDEANNIILRSKFIFGDGEEIIQHMSKVSFSEELEKIKKIEQSSNEILIGNKIGKILSEDNSKVNILLDGKEIKLFKYQI